MDRWWVAEVEKEPIGEEAARGGLGVLVITAYTTVYALLWLFATLMMLQMPVEMHQG